MRTSHPFPRARAARRIGAAVAFALPITVPRPTRVHGTTTVHGFGRTR
jgi:hypothetical protein